MKKTGNKTTKKNAAEGHNSTALGYTGTLTVRLQHGKNTLSNKTYHNAGTKNLFKFLCSCLAGEFTNSDRPCRIRLFGSNGCDGTPATFSNTAENWSDSLTPILLNDTPATIDATAIDGISGTEYYNTRFHFRIPFSYVNQSETTKIYKAALFSETSSNYQGMLAWFLFTTEDGSAFDPIDLVDLSGNFSIVIEWTMTLTNRGTGA